MKRMIVIVLIVFMLAGAVSCANKAQSGAGMGALAGGLVGSLVAGNKLTGAVIGAGIGLALGYIIGNEWDKYDQQQMNRTLEHSPSGQTTSWVNPDSGAKYQATPQPAYTQDGKVYRDVQLKGVVDGKDETVNAKAYRNPDGTWQLVQ